jgi:hypothetical protein
LPIGVANGILLMIGIPNRVVEKYNDAKDSSYCRM